MSKNIFPKYDSEDHEQKATAILAHLGRFVVDFERVCEGMRSCIHCTFRREGLRNQALSQAVVNGKTVRDLRETLGAVFTELADQDDSDRKCVKEVLDRVEKLAAQRNHFLHSDWHLNYDYENAGEEFYALAISHKASAKKGAYAAPLSVSQQNLAASIREAEEIQVLLARLAICLNQKSFKVSDMFAKPL